MNIIGKNPEGAEFLGCNENLFAQGEERKKLAEIIKIGAKFRRQLFDDYSFIIGEKTKLEADFECAVRIIEIVADASLRGDFYVVHAKKDEGEKEAKSAGKSEIAGFWYIYDINYERRYENSESLQEVKKPVIGTIAGCLKKEYWGAPARKIMDKVLDEIFYAEGFEKIKCETFSSNPYIESFLKEFNFRLEGVLKNETKVAGKRTDIKIWAKERDILKNEEK